MKNVTLSTRISKGFDGVYLTDNFGEALRLVTDTLDAKNFYAFNPSFDK